MHPKDSAECVSPSLLFQAFSSTPAGWIMARMLAWYCLKEPPQASDCVGLCAAPSRNLQKRLHVPTPCGYRNLTWSKFRGGRQLRLPVPCFAGSRRQGGGGGDLASVLEAAHAGPLCDSDSTAEVSAVASLISQQ